MRYLVFLAFLATWLVADYEQFHTECESLGAYGYALNDDKPNTIQKSKIDAANNLIKKIEVEVDDEGMYQSLCKDGKCSEEYKDKITSKISKSIPIVYELHGDKDYFVNDDNLVTTKAKLVCSKLTYKSLRGEIPSYGEFESGCDKIRAYGYSNDSNILKAIKKAKMRAKSNISKSKSTLIKSVEIDDTYCQRDGISDSECTNSYIQKIKSSTSAKIHIAFVEAKGKDYKKDNGTIVVQAKLNCSKSVYDQIYKGIK
jgi:hypothetical protein